MILRFFVNWDNNIDQIYINEKTTDLSELLIHIN
jgi:hypothetical protein